ncbi:MAG: DUF58 domain-containing protein [Planctomycetaceae bacterium]|nr:DUF58 domain-containing protein [Planctomycetaceae bacterium]
MNIETPVRQRPFPAILKNIVRLLPAPTAVGVIYLIVALLVYLQASREADDGVRNLLIFAASGIAALHAVSLILGWLNIRNINVTRSVRGYARAGSPLAIGFTLRNKRRLFGASALRLREEEHGGLVIRESYAPAAWIPARGERRVQLHGLLPKRGMFTFTEMQLSSAFPFGMLRFSCRVKSASKVCVYPRSLPIPAWLGERLLRVAHHHGESLASTQGEDEIYGIREYRTGDNPRRIHWPTTARLGSPMLLEMEGRQDMIFRLILDTYDYDNQSAKGPELERLISLAAGVVEELHRRGMAIGMSHHGNDYLSLAEERGEPVYHAAMEMLAGAQRSATPLSQWCAQAVGDAARGARLVVLTGASPAQVREFLPGPATSRRTAVLSMRDLDMIALFTNPALPEQSARDTLALLLEE